jgi:hypothetical protein
MVTTKLTPDDAVIEPATQNQNDATILSLKFQNGSMVKHLITVFSSVISRLVCIFTISYVNLIIFYETESYLTLFNFVFCLAIFMDTVRYLKTRKDYLRHVVLFFTRFEDSLFFHFVASFLFFKLQTIYSSL